MKRLGKLRHLKNLGELDLQCLPSDDVKNFTKAIPIIKRSWPNISATLRSLTLRVPFECLKALLSPSLSFPRLTHLKIHVFTTEHSTNLTDAINSTLLPFINRHAPTVERLAIITPDTCPVDLSPMFASLQPFPRLKSLELELSAFRLEQLNLSGVSQFLHVQALQLEELRLHFVRVRGLREEEFDANAFFALPFFHIHLPTLTTLDLGFSGFRDGKGAATMRYVHRFASTLQRLVLQHIFLAQRGLVRLVKPLIALQTLKIATTYFTPEILDTLSNEVPDLTELHVRCVNYDGGHNRSSEVCLCLLSDFLDSGMLNITFSVQWMFQT